MPSQAQNRATAKYIKKAYQRYEVKLKRAEDKELIEHMEKQPSKSEYLKQLIARDLQSK